MKNASLFSVAESMGGGASIDASVAVSQTSSMQSALRDVGKTEEQIAHYSRKIEVEQNKGRALDRNIKETQDQIASLHAITLGGAVIADSVKSYKKNISILEKKLQSLRMQLSKSSSENHMLKDRINFLRTDKLMYLNIHSDLVKESAQCTAKCAEAQKEIASIVEEKQRIKMESLAVKHQMVNDVEMFNRELESVKNTISISHHEQIESMRMNLNTSVTSGGSRMRRFKTKQRSPNKANEISKLSLHENATDGVRTQAEVVLAVKALGFESLPDFLAVHQQSEEQIFGIYKDIQELNEELEILESNNRKLEAEVGGEVDKVRDMEKSNEQLKAEIEQQLASIEKSMEGCTLSYQNNVQILEGLNEYLMNILKNVASDVAVDDQHLLSVGLNDRSIDEFMSIIEQRVDELIQMLRAVSKESIRAEDFQRGLAQPPVVVVDRKGSLGVSAAAAGGGFHVVVPSVTDIADDEDEPDESGKIQPINLGQLKDYMQRRMQKMMGKKPPKSNNPAGGAKGGNQQQPESPDKEDGMRSPSPV